MRRLHAAGYRNYQIARFMQASESTVSNAVRRWKPAVGHEPEGELGQTTGSTAERAAEMSG